MDTSREVDRPKGITFPVSPNIETIVIHVELLNRRVQDLEEVVRILRAHLLDGTSLQ